MSSNELLVHPVACRVHLHSLTDMSVSQLCCLQLTVLAGMVPTGLRHPLLCQLEAVVQ